MTPRRRRLLASAAIFVATGAGVTLVANAFRSNLVFFHSPSELVNPGALTDRRLRVGGLVEEGSVVQGGATVTFRITDLANTVPVAYTGILPDLFREGQGVVAEGRMEQGVFVADQVLARHDENYMPPEVADALKQSGQWQHMREAMEGAGQLPEGEAR